eukprot:scaffold911_cov361-Prasinococcus_capsulatus_cf.AAC.15
MPAAARRCSADAHAPSLAARTRRPGARQAKPITDAAIKALSDHTKAVVKDRLAGKSAGGSSKSSSSSRGSGGRIAAPPWSLPYAIMSALKRWCSPHVCRRRGHHPEREQLRQPRHTEPGPVDGGVLRPLVWSLPTARS